MFFFARRSRAVNQEVVEDVKLYYLNKVVDKITYFLWPLHSVDQNDMTVIGKIISIFVQF